VREEPLAAALPLRRSGKLEVAGCRLFQDKGGDLHRAHLPLPFAEEVGHSFRRSSVSEEVPSDYDVTSYFMVATGSISRSRTMGSHPFLQRLVHARLPSSPVALKYSTTSGL
jgi:hypothetical protein